jgi:hypothetical protein
LAEAGGEAEELEPAELEDRGDDDTPVTSEASAAVTSHIVTLSQKRCNCTTISLIGYRAMARDSHQTF